MTEDIFYRHQISRQHLEVLAQYMERYPPLALASTRSREGLIQSKRMWEKIARTLNRIDDNVTKSGKSWSRYWIHLKFKIRRKYAVIQKCQLEGTHCTIQLDPFEERIVKILTDEEGNLLKTTSTSTYYTYFSYKTKSNRLSNLKSISDNDTKIDDSGGLETADEQLQDDYLIAQPSPRTEHILLPDCNDTKPSIHSLKHDTDPIQIVEEKKTVEEIRRELMEFELKKQKELFEMEKEFKREKHELEMSILRVKKQLMMKELKKL